MTPKLYLSNVWREEIYICSNASLAGNLCTANVQTKTEKIALPIHLLMSQLGNNCFLFSEASFPYK